MHKFDLEYTRGIHRLFFVVFFDILVKNKFKSDKHNNNIYLYTTNILQFKK
jgi:hypothetical protein